MKNGICLMLVFLTSFVGVSAQLKVDSLIEAQKYLSAYTLLERADQDNERPDVVLKKIDLALNYYLDSEYHRSFSFIDLRSGEVLQELREANMHGATPYLFNVDSILLDLIVVHPTDYRLHLSLANYYNKVYYDFGDRWGERSEILLDKSYSYYLKAYENGIYDYYSLYALGYYQTLSQNYFEAQRWFLKSLEVKPKEALTNYNLAVTYLFDGLPNKGISYSIKAYEMYADSLKKGDAARITGILYSKIGDNTQALNYFYRANELSPNYRPNQMYLLKSYLQLDKDSLAVQLAYEVLITTLHGPEIAEEYIEMFGQFNKEELLYQVFDRTLLTHSSDAEACGNICFHYGKVLYKKGRKHDSKQMIKRSKKYFLKVFDKNHQVFEAIDQMLNISAKKPY